MMKPEIRVLGIDDSPFRKRDKGKKVAVYGVLYRGGSFLDGILSTAVHIDGSDATEKIIEMVQKSKFRPQIQAIFIDGIAFGGFNIVDIAKVFEKTKIPVIAVMRKQPNLKKIKKALQNLPDFTKKYKLLLKAGEIHSIEVKPGINIYVQIAGMSIATAGEFLKITCKHSHIPEPIRVAHLIGQGIYFSESKGKA